MTATPDQLIEASRNFMVAANRLPTFYSLGEEWSTLIDLLEDESQDEEVIQQELERVAGDIRGKAYGLAVVTHSLERLAEMQASEAKRLAAKAKSNQSHADRLRAYALSVMRSMPNCERIETGTFTLAIRLNAPSVQVTDAAAVPPEFNRTKIVVEVDKIAVKDHWKATGEIVPGVDIVRTERLEIK